MDDGKLAIQSK